MRPKGRRLKGLAVQKRLNAFTAEPSPSLDGLEIAEVFSDTCGRRVREGGPADDCGTQSRGVIAAAEGGFAVATSTRPDRETASQQTAYKREMLR